MKKNPSPEKNLRQPFRLLTTCLFFTLLFAGVFTVKAQKIFSPPLSSVSKDYKLDKLPSPPVVNAAPALPLNPSVGTWTTITQPAPHGNLGGMLLLSDGTVLVKSSGGSGGNGTIYDKLTPDASGSYVNGTWSSIAPMNNDRLYYSSQVLKDGRVYVAGGEYGTGKDHGEVYDPLANTWTLTPDPGYGISDANSEILENGSVLQAMVNAGTGTAIYNPNNNTYSTGPTTLDYFDESTWVKLPDNSILYVDVTFGSGGDDHSTERYIPSLNQWVADANVPVSLYDPYGYECGGAFLLPDGRAFFIGSTGHTAYYTPSGNASPGTWAAGPDIPNSLGAPDAPAAMMVNGKILCAFSPTPTSDNHFPSPTYFYEFDYTNNTFTQINAPGGGSTIDAPSFIFTMLDLPDGTVLFSSFNDNHYYIYTPAGNPLASGKPVISSITQTACATYQLTGTGFNGISEGASYGDDWQMATNYPIVRLTSGSNVYYCRTSNWNSTGVMRGSAPDEVTVDLPAGLPDGTYSLVVTANGIASDPISITTGVQTWYYDGDGDSYYGNTQQSCTNPGTGWSLNSLGSDCDDNDNTVYPGAPELCDGKDNNCDGNIDEGCAITKIRINDVAITEGNSGSKNLTFTVTLSKKPTQTVKVNFHTANISASSNTDYVAKSGTLSFTNGVRNRKISITIKGDTKKESDETFKVVLSNAVNAIIADNTGIGTILNDDGNRSLVPAADESSSGIHLITVSPNPASNFVNVQLNGFTGKVMLQLMNLQGRELKSISLQADNVKSMQQHFNVSDVASGTYFIVVMDEHGNKETKKVVVTH